MLEINKNYVLDGDRYSIAVQITIAEFEKTNELSKYYIVVR